MNEIERGIIMEVAERIEDGREVYGPWALHDDRQTEVEAYEEILDAMAYVAKKLLELRSGR
ncbi:MAG: hypothetical protein GY851_07290 [bacterium]|nr:hypothetical protein [bacterium]